MVLQPSCILRKPSRPSQPHQWGFFCSSVIIWVDGRWGWVEAVFVSLSISISFPVPGRAPSAAHSGPFVRLLVAQSSSRTGPTRQASPSLNLHNAAHTHRQVQQPSGQPAVHLFWSCRWRSFTIMFNVDNLLMAKQTTLRRYPAECWIGWWWWFLLLYFSVFCYEPLRLHKIIIYHHFHSFGPHWNGDIILPIHHSSNDTANII